MPIHGDPSYHGPQVKPIGLRKTTLGNPLEAKEQPGSMPRRTLRNTRTQLNTVLAWVGALVLGGALVLVGAAAAGEPSGEVERGFRRPIALQLSSGDATLYVANRDSGTISVVDTKSGTIVDESPVGHRLSDLAWIPETQTLVATDEGTHELLVIDVQRTDVAPMSGGPPTLSVRQRLAVSPYPVSVVVTADGRRCFVASLWSRRLTRVELSLEDRPIAHLAGSLDLDIAPRKQLLVRSDSYLLVADSFQGRLAVIDTGAWGLRHVRKFPGHNIRGLGITRDGQTLIVAQQMLNQLAHTVQNDVHWGLLMSNDLRWARLDAVLDAQADLYDGGRMQPLGEAGRATGDPSGLAVAPNGRVIVALGGVGEVAISREPNFGLARVNVGRRPTALAVTRDSRRAYVANTFQDTISVVELDKMEVTSKILLGAAPQPTLVQRGELLFYDARLSHDGWMSCHSCHTDGHTNGLLNDNFSDGSFGAPKQILSVLGRRGTAPFGWLAGAESLADQVRRSITDTMQTDAEIEPEEIDALVAYVESLPPPPPLEALRGIADPESIRRGNELFQALECANCHSPPTYTTPATYDVGLQDKLGRTHFNPPSLRGVGQRQAYFHDNRASTLADVFTLHAHQLDRELEAHELSSLLDFLRSL